MDTTDFMAREAAKIAAAAGKPQLEFTTDVLRYRNGTHCYTMIGYDPTHPLEVQDGYGMANDLQEALGRLAESLGVAYPLPSQPSLSEQKEEIIRLLNNPVITRQEKTRVLLHIVRMNEEMSQLTIDELRSKIDQRENGTVAIAA